MNVANRMQGDRTQAVADSIQEYSERVREQLDDLDQRTRTFVVEHPLAAVVAAAAVGYFLARLLSRR